MRIRSFRSILNECLMALQQGESVEACLSRYPKQAQRLGPLLTLAQRVGRTPPAAPRPWAQKTAWDLVRQRATDLREGRRRPRAGVTWLRPLAITASLLLALLAASGGTVYAAQGSLPDSPLYRVKLATEDVRLWFVFDDAERAKILLDQSDERTEEIMELIQRGKSVPANVLSALRDRNARAARILEERPQETVLLARMLQQSKAQEELLLALWDESESARDEYAEAVAALHSSRLRSSGAVTSIEPEDLAGGVLNISGLVEPVIGGVWLVGGVEVRVDERTIGGGDLEAGRTAKFIVARGANGRLHALSLSIIEAGQPESGTVVSGALEEVTDDEILVAGQRIAITPETLLKLKLQEGQRVEITVSSGASGAVASAVEPADTEADLTDAPTLTYEGTIKGEVSTDDQTNEWVIGGLTFVITPATVVDAQAGDVEAGARAFVEAVSTGDQLFLAERVIILAADADSDDVFLTGVFQPSSDGRWLVSGLRVEPEEGMRVPEVGSLVAIDAERHGERIVGREATVLEPPGQEGPVRLQGLIAGIDGDIWTIGFARVRVGEDAELFGEAIVGARALVWGREGSDGALQAAYVRILDQRPIISAEEP